MIRYLTAGESHGPVLTAIIEGIPANLEISEKFINAELARRQSGYGRGARQKIEKDTVKILSGVRHGKTLGSPITLAVENNDFANWQKIMSAEAVREKITAVTKLRPGHADYAGVIKYNQKDIRNILERSSARSTAVQVAVGAVCKQFLNQFKISIFSNILSVEKVSVNSFELNDKAKKKIDQAKTDGDSLGGIVEIIVKNPPIGLGSHVQNDRKLDARLALALMGIQAVKGVEVGLGFDAARMPGSEFHDEIVLKNGKIIHTSNNAGGIEGGMSNGEDIVLRAAFKPIPTMVKPLKTIDWQTKKPADAHVERADVCAIEAAAVIAEAAVAIEVVNSFLEKFGGDSLEEIKSRY